MQDYRMETLITVCKYMNFTKAAQELHLAQSTVSLHIRNLEDYYGTKLFLLKGKSIVLTEEGKLILETAITQRHDEQRLMEKIQRKHRVPIRLGATLSVAENMLGNSLTAFLMNHPRDYLQIDTDNTEHLLEKIDQGVLDAAFVEGPYSLQAFEGLIYKSEPFIAVCAPDYPGWKMWTQLCDLLTAPLLLREQGSGSREILEKFLNSQTYTLQSFAQIIEIGSVHLIKEVVKAGGGISFLYKATVKQELETGALIEIPVVPAICHDIFFLWRKGSIHAGEYRALYEEFVKRQ